MAGPQPINHLRVTWRPISKAAAPVSPSATPPRALNLGGSTALGPSPHSADPGVSPPPAGVHPSPGPQAPNGVNGPAGGHQAVVYGGSHFVHDDGHVSGGPGSSTRHANNALALRAHVRSSFVPPNIQRITGNRHYFQPKGQDLQAHVVYQGKGLPWKYEIHDASKGGYKNNAPLAHGTTSHTDKNGAASEAYDELVKHHVHALGQYVKHHQDVVAAHQRASTAPSTPPVTQPTQTLSQFHNTVRFHGYGKDPNNHPSVRSGDPVNRAFSNPQSGVGLVHRFPPGNPKLFKWAVDPKTGASVHMQYTGKGWDLRLFDSYGNRVSPLNMPGGNAVHVIRGTGTKYAEQVASMLLYNHVHGGQIKLPSGPAPTGPTGGQTALQHAGQVPSTSPSAAGPPSTSPTGGSSSIPPAPVPISTSALGLYGQSLHSSWSPSSAMRGSRTVELIHPTGYSIQEDPTTQTKYLVDPRGFDVHSAPSYATSTSIANWAMANHPALRSSVFPPGTTAPQRHAAGFVSVPTYPRANGHFSAPTVSQDYYKYVGANPQVPHGWVHSSGTPGTGAYQVGDLGGQCSVRWHKDPGSPGIRPVVVDEYNLVGSHPSIVAEGPTVSVGHATDDHLHAMAAWWDNHGNGVPTNHPTNAPRTAPPPVTPTPPATPPAPLVPKVPAGQFLGQLQNPWSFRTKSNQPTQIMQHPTSGHTVEWDPDPNVPFNYVPVVKDPTGKVLAQGLQSEGSSTAGTWHLRHLADWAEKQGIIPTPAQASSPTPSNAAPSSQAPTAQSLQAYHASLSSNSFTHPRGTSALFFPAGSDAAARYNNIASSAPGEWYQDPSTGAMVHLASSSTTPVSRGVWLFDKNGKNVAGPRTGTPGGKSFLRIGGPNGHSVGQPYARAVAAAVLHNHVHGTSIPVHNANGALAGVTAGPQGFQTALDHMFPQAGTQAPSKAVWVGAPPPGATGGTPSYVWSQWTNPNSLPIGGVSSGLPSGWTRPSTYNSPLLQRTTGHTIHASYSAAGDHYVSLHDPTGRMLYHTLVSPTSAPLDVAHQLARHYNASIGAGNVAPPPAATPTSVQRIRGATGLHPPATGSGQTTLPLPYNIQRSHLAAHARTSAPAGWTAVQPGQSPTIPSGIGVPPTLAQNQYLLHHPSGYSVIGNASPWRSSYNVTVYHNGMAVSRYSGTTTKNTQQQMQQRVHQVANWVQHHQSTGQPLPPQPTPPGTPVVPSGTLAPNHQFVGIGAISGYPSSSQSRPNGWTYGDFAASRTSSFGPDVSHVYTGPTHQVVVRYQPGSSSNRVEVFNNRTGQVEATHVSAFQSQWSESDARHLGAQMAHWINTIHAPGGSSTPRASTPPTPNSPPVGAPPVSASKVVLQPGQTYTPPPVPDNPRRSVNEIYHYGQGAGHQGVKFQANIDHQVITHYSNDPTKLSSDWSVGVNNSHGLSQFTNQKTGYTVEAQPIPPPPNAIGKTNPTDEYYTILVRDKQGNTISSYDTQAARDKAYIQQRVTQVAHWVDEAHKSSVKTQATAATGPVQFQVQPHHTTVTSPAGAPPFALDSKGYDDPANQAAIANHLKAQFPKLVGLRQHGPHDDSNGHKVDPVEHTMRVIDPRNLRVEGLPERDAQLLRLAMVYHDVGKQYDAYDPEHARKSVGDSRDLLWNHNLTPQEHADVKRIIKWHDAYGEAAKGGFSSSDAKKVAEKAGSERMADLLLRAWQSDLNVIPGLTADRKLFPHNNGSIDVEKDGPKYLSAVKVAAGGSWSTNPKYEKDLDVEQPKAPAATASPTQSLTAPGLKYGELVQQAEDLKLGNPVGLNGSVIPPQEVYDEAHQNPDLNYARAFNMAYDGPTGRIVHVYHAGHTSKVGPIANTGLFPGGMLDGGRSGTNAYGRGVYTTVNGATSTPSSFRNGAIFQAELHTGRTINVNDLDSRVVPQWKAQHPQEARRLRQEDQRAAAALWAGYSTIGVNYSHGNPTLVVVDPSRLRFLTAVDDRRHKAINTDSRGNPIKVGGQAIQMPDLQPHEVTTPVGHPSYHPVKNGVPEGWKGTARTK